ncbi:MAG: hypothetical protein NTW48_01530 [Chloroflexi bacterium]|nr:hypothetical protein [Chloroflexota bacterium]
MRNLRTFLTASSLLVAVLLFWAQLWERSPAQGREYVVGLGLSWTFASVLLTLFAMAWAGFASVRDRKDRGESPAPPLSIGLFGASIIMTIYNIGLSCLAIIAETASKQAISIVPLVGNETLLPCYGISLFIIFLMIVGFSIWFSRGREFCWAQSIASLTLLILVAGIINEAFNLRDTPSSAPNWTYLLSMLVLMICGAGIAIYLICYLCRKGK